MLAALAAIVSVGCIAASVRRLAVVASPTAFDPESLARALRAPADLAALRHVLERSAAGSWEHGLLEAATARDPSVRGALIDEQVLEADWTLDGWGRVPRVCASVSTSAGFLCAALVLIQALGVVPSETDGADSASIAAGPIVISALDALALGIVGTAFAVAVHVKARAAARSARAALDALVDRVRSLAIS